MRYLKHIVEESTLSKASKQRVIEKLDYLLGENALAYKFPLDVEGLDEDEAITFCKVIRWLNESRKLPRVTNDFQYRKVVKEILKAAGKPTKELVEVLSEMDEAFNDGDWDEVNKYLQIIGGMV